MPPAAARATVEYGELHVRIPPSLASERVGVTNSTIYSVLSIVMCPESQTVV